jgi:hypothetical protein
MNAQKFRDEAAHQLQLAETELAVLKKELFLQNMLGTAEPIEQASQNMTTLREALARHNKAS